MNTIIRTAEEKDRERIRPMQKEIAELHHRGRPDLFRPEPPYFSKESFAELLNDPKALILIAQTEDGTVAGYAFTKIISFRNHPTNLDFDCFYIDELFVLQSHRRQGIGRMLMEHCKKIAKESGCKMMDLNVWSFNQEANSFYERLGMKERTRRMELSLEE